MAAGSGDDDPEADRGCRSAARSSASRVNLWHREAGLAPDYLATYDYVATVGALLRFWTFVCISTP